MAKFTDENGIKWDIRTTTVQVGPSTPKGTWFAAIDDATERDYSGNQFALNEDETFDGQGGQTTVITWPKDGNPILRGPGNEDAALASVRAFAARQKAAKLVNVALRVQSSPPNTGSGSLLALLAIAVLVYYADQGKR